MLTRREQEWWEDERLASYAAKSGASLGRKYPEKEHSYRTAFQRDRDRIIHSNAFRRLEYKTQVFVNHEGDYYRTRLTHSLEAAQIARTIARILKLNEDLAEALALSHDLGHTPFGHSGEDALKEAMKKYGGFEHNLQSLRIVEILEKPYPNFRGLNLCWETRESIRKHSIKPGYPVEAGYKPKWGRLLEAQVVDYADSIAYAAHDIDDGIKAGLITVKDMEAVGLWNEAIGSAKDASMSDEAKIKRAVRYIIDLEVTDLIENTERNIKRVKIKDLSDVRKAKTSIVSLSDKVERKKELLHSFLQKNLYRHYRVVRMSEKAKKFVLELFNEYMRCPDQMPPQFQAWAKEAGLPKAIADYIAGMTDRYAQEEYMKLFEPFERV